MVERDWYKCHGQGWGSLCIPAAYAHPAKFSRALIRRIYDHLFEQGYLHEGETIVDPFGGVSLGALHAMQHGCHWIGVELEQKFVDLGSHYDCPGFTAGEWRRYHHRVDRVNDGPHHHWCPDCVEAMRNVGESRKVPMHRLHRYQGNIDLWNERYAEHLPRWGSAVLLRGDSRELVQVMGQVAGVSISSPPYGKSLDNILPRATDGKDNGAVATFRRTGKWPERRPKGLDYGSASDNLGNLRANDADHAAALRQGQVAASVSSPVYPDARDGIPSKGENIPTRYGKHPKNLGNMRGTTTEAHQAAIQAAISSSPYTASLASDDPDKRGGLFRDPKRRSDKTLTAEYGESEGQLGAMKEGNLQAAISSPPYSGKREGGGVPNPDKIDIPFGRSQFLTSDCYGESNGQLGAMPAGDHAAQVQGSVPSPPFEDQNACNDPNYAKDRKTPGGPLYGDYGNSVGQLGQEQGDTFWSAAKTIVEQTYQVLAPGAVAVWVCKSFIRKKKRVDFPGQWRELCEACGFETIEWIRAWLVEDRGNARALFDFETDKMVVKQGETVHTVGKRSKEVKPAELKRCSFFRKLAESKGSPTIDYEVVIIQRKPGG